MQATLYERLGGEAAIMAVASQLYEKLLADPALAPYFAGLDMEQQVRKQVGFLSWAFGADTKYEFRPLRAAHARLVRDQGLANEHFDRVARHLAEVLMELGVEPQLVTETLAIVASTRGDVLGG